MMTSSSQPSIAVSTRSGCLPPIAPPHVHHGPRGEVGQKREKRSSSSKPLPRGSRSPLRAASDADDGSARDGAGSDAPSEPTAPARRQGQAWDAEAEMQSRKELESQLFRLLERTRELESMLQAAGAPEAQEELVRLRADNEYLQRDQAMLKAELALVKGEQVRAKEIGVPALGEDALAKWAQRQK